MFWVVISCLIILAGLCILLGCRQIARFFVERRNSGEDWYHREQETLAGNSNLATARYWALKRGHNHVHRRMRGFFEDLLGSQWQMVRAESSLHQATCELKSDLDL